MLYNDTASELYVGILSGTSLDGVDIALVSIENESLKLKHSSCINFPTKLQQQITTAINQKNASFVEIGSLNVAIGELFANAVNKFLSTYEIPASRVRAIGSHGITLFHSPTTEYPFSWQIGDPNVIAYRTKITTVSDFRGKDVAAGGHGAPLAPLFHKTLFANKMENRAIVNIGGIANITFIAKENDIPITGFDTGPGNTLMDYWCQQNLKKDFDYNGDWAATGKINDLLLQILLDDPYFNLPAPKSTGREHFNPQWLQHKLNNFNKKIAAADVQATLNALTATTIINAINNYQCHINTVVICGGGAYNKFLLDSIKKKSQKEILISDDLGFEANWIEAMMFAWLAKQTLDNKHINSSYITGAKNKLILGSITPA